MHHPHRRHQQLSGLREELRRLPGLFFSNVLTAEDVSSAIQLCDWQFRQWLFSPWVTVWMFVWQAISPDGSCRGAGLRLLADRPESGEAMVATTGGYCRIRRRLPLDFLKRLIHRVAEKLFQRLAGEHRWCGHRVKIVDGNTVSMPDTAANQVLFPQ